MTDTDNFVNEIENNFLDACRHGNLNVVVDLYNEYYLHHKSFFKKTLSFFKLSKLSSIILDPHCQSNLPFRYAAFSGHIDIVEFLLKDEHFIRKIPQKELLDALSSAISINDINIVKAISPFIAKNSSIADSIEKGFLEACAKGYIDTVLYTTENIHIALEYDADLYEKVDASSKYFFGYTYAPLIAKGFITACKHNQLKLVEKMLENQDYLRSANKDPTLIDGLGNSIANNQIELSKYLISKITNKPQYFYDTVCLSFAYACNQGHLDIVKSLLENSEWNLDAPKIFNQPYHSKLSHHSTSTAIEDGFINAFEQGKSDIIKYLTNSPKSAFYFDISKLNNQISANFKFKDEHIDVMQYLIFDLGFKKTTNHINFSKEINELFEKKNMYEQLNNDLDINGSQYNHKAKLGKPIKL